MGWVLPEFNKKKTLINWSDKRQDPKGPSSTATNILCLYDRCSPTGQRWSVTKAMHLTASYNFGVTGAFPTLLVLICWDWFLFWPQYANWILAHVEQGSWGPLPDSPRTPGSKLLLSLACLYRWQPVLSAWRMSVLCCLGWSLCSVICWKGIIWTCTGTRI